MAKAKKQRKNRHKLHPTDLRLAELIGCKSEDFETMLPYLNIEQKLRGKLTEALETQRLFLTISFQKNSWPQEVRQIQHYWFWRQFLVYDVALSLTHLAEDFAAKEKIAQLAAQPKLEHSCSKIENIGDVAKRLGEALGSGRIFITVTFQKKYHPTDRHDLQHFWIRKNLKLECVIPSLKAIMDDFNSRENPSAASSGDAWH